ncbi:hypothetical protein QN277_022537 [Acacia crassicarpa]|uniref:D-isomer specific 2-hydroxyacid dehydrogenase NAD-binding domain-containing protein n=1 Tax=Acacia crassicarpa TaxID=499986 RepID=A0AAE1JH18_9FABA|nr:hypothetical protein QN277_022537 [Acacia crassicarpa]
MESIGVLLLCPVLSYLDQELDNRYKLYRYWNYPQSVQFLEEHANSILAVVSGSNYSTDDALIDALPKLEFVSSFSVGVDHIDLNKCREKGIRVTNTPDVLTDEVADLTIGLILAVLRRLCECDRYVRSGKWKKGDYKLTTKVTVILFVDFCIASNFVAKRTEGFNCKISYYSRTEKPESNHKYYPSVVELASNCNILVVACPLTEETHHIINREVLKALGPKGVLINID